MNQFVDFIRQFYSQSTASSDAAYAERSSNNLKGIELKTSSLVEDILKGNINALILTGNAGDGKTFLCKEIYEKLTGNPFRNEAIVKEPLKETFKGKNLYLIKDASEVDQHELKDVVTTLENKISPQILKEDQGKLKRDIIIIAGNEGKLSQLFENCRGLSRLLLNALRAEFYDIGAKPDSDADSSGVKIVNFNWRALVAGKIKATTTKDKSAFESILEAFLNEDEWNVCQQCSVHRTCPIYFNARTMREKEVIDRIHKLFKFLHYLVGHFTMRELFSVLSYFITADKNCRQINEFINSKEEEENYGSLADYIFYNNIFAINAGTRQLEDKILNEIRKYDVAYAPLPVLNNPLLGLYIDMENYLGTEDEEQLFSDLLILRDLKQGSTSDGQKQSSKVLDYLKRRLYFLPVQVTQAWPSVFVGEGEYKSLHGIKAEFFFPFKGFKHFDEFMSGEQRDAQTFKQEIVNGLNLMVNRYDPENEFFLKAYKPQRRGQSYSLEIRNELVEDVEVLLRIENPCFGTEYLEVLPRRLALEVNALGNGSTGESRIILPIDIEMYELLYNILKGNQARYGFRDILGIINDFREAFYYQLLKHIDKPKFGLDTAQKSKGALEIAAKNSEIRIKQVS